MLIENFELYLIELTIKFSSSVKLMFPSSKSVGKCGISKSSVSDKDSSLTSLTMLATRCVKLLKYPINVFGLGQSNFGNSKSHQTKFSRNVDNCI